MALGIVTDPVFQDHDTGPYHCETSRRLEAIDQALAAWAGRDRLTFLPLRPATEEEILRAHTSSHLSRVASTKGQEVMLDPDTAASPRSFEVALLAAGSLVDLCDAALGGDVDQGFALVRPPGHHATENRAMGFCLFNNVAIAATHLLEARGLERVLIVDWDVHHGNGTEDIFYSSHNVLYFSTHQFPFYPGTGSVKSMGAGAGAGYTMNVPLRSGQGDDQYLRIYEDLLVPVAREYQPQFILVSAGFDPHREDPLGGMSVSAAGFGALAGIVKDLADELCPGRLVLTLEGGYALAAQARSVIKVLETLGGAPHRRSALPGPGKHRGPGPRPHQGCVPLSLGYELRGPGPRVRPACQVGL